MVAALSPADINYDETLSTLRYTALHYAALHHNPHLLSLFVGDVGFTSFSARLCRFRNV